MKFLDRFIITEFLRKSLRCGVILNVIHTFFLNFFVFLKKKLHTEDGSIFPANPRVYSPKLLAAGIEDTLLTCAVEFPDSIYCRVNNHYRKWT